MQFWSDFLREKKKDPYFRTGITWNKTKQNKKKKKESKLIKIHTKKTEKK